MKEKNDLPKKSKFQKELEWIVSRRIILTIFIGCFFFCAAFVAVNTMNQYLNQKKHLDSMTDTFQEVYCSVESFLDEEENTENFIRCICEDGIGSDKIRYCIAKYNSEAPVRIHLMIMDAEENLVFSNYYGEQMNLHRLEFNRIVGENAEKNEEDIYETVYYFSGDTSEYVMSRSLYVDGSYIGNVSAYLNGSDWRYYFSKYQYDTILTTDNYDIIYCSNGNFLKERNANKYRPADAGRYVWADESRYLVGSRVLADKEVRLYSFIYSPRNVAYIAIGILTILILGLIWTVMFYQMLGVMARKTAESVGALVDEIRYIRTEDTEHVIRIQTGDEIEEIADQINKMIKSINELNARNMELLQINSRMELQNLQAQINPHFIYNTLDNIKYLIVQAPSRAEELIERFTHILRYSINNTKNKVPLCEDMEYIEDYLVIQKTRFGSRFIYEIMLEPSCNDIMIPKLLLQPLIENSIKYGFRKKPEIRVCISGKVENGYLRLCVSDNGAGMPTATLEQLRMLLRRESADSGHNGMQNINRRILLEYGKESGVYPESVDGEGFTVVLKLWLGE